MLSVSERRDWVRLIRTPTVGPVAFKSLLQRFGTIPQAMEALPSMTRRRPLAMPAVAEIEAEMEAAERLGVHMIASCEPDYPPLLRALHAPPPIVSVWGDISMTHRPCVAIVGSRNASAVGIRFSGDLASDLGDAGVTVVSGLARGIDTAAHHGALSGGTAAVLGGGVDDIYPRQNAGLFEAIKEQGCLISESPLGHKATARDFPRRNRIVSGLSHGVVVIEAAERSGTLITARYATEQNREVMAVPGSPLDPRAKGCNRLIRDGAALIESVDDVIAAIGTVRSFDVREDNDTDMIFVTDLDDNDIGAIREAVARLVSPSPVPQDTLIRLSGYPASHVLGILLEMELCGDVIVEPDGQVRAGLSSLF